MDGFVPNLVKGVLSRMQSIVRNFVAIGSWVSIL